jgi:hypothetical protein
VVKEVMDVNKFSIGGGQDGCKYIVATLMGQIGKFIMLSLRLAL